MIQGVPLKLTIIVNVYNIDSEYGINQFILFSYSGLLLNYSACPWRRTK